MHISPTALLAFVLLSLPISSAVSQTDQEPPTAVIVRDDFSPGAGQAWQPISGRWSMGDGTYASTLAGGDDISTITSYRGLHPAQPPEPQLSYSHFFVRARMRNQGFGENHLVGLVYQYQDPLNYYEVVVSARGTVTVRTVANGVAVDEAPSVMPNIQRNTWFDLEVRWNNGVTSVKINGSTAYTTISQPEFTSGQVGLVTHAAVGRFDKVFIGVPFGDQAFLEMFDDEPSITFRPQSGQWTIANGTYNSGVQQTSITLAPIRSGVDVAYGDTIAYTFRARLLNPYGASGNLVGIVFNLGYYGYSEVVFSPIGVARINRFENGALRTLATANYNGRRNVPFDVTLENSPNGVVISVDGERIFDNVPYSNPSGYPEGGVGLISHWAPGRFDNVQFNRGVFQPCSFTFDSEPPPHWLVSGTWNATGGSLNNTSPGASDIVNLNCAGNVSGEDAGTNAIYRARLFNEYGASGNLVGLVYNYQDSNSFYAGDYHEVVFSPTGVMQLNKFIQGVRYNLGSFAHNVPRKTWFDVELITSGGFISVKVNGAPIVTGVPQNSGLTGGSVGVITHWAKGRFDDVSLSEYVASPP